jgi:hypothetical protein
MGFEARSARLDVGERACLRSILAVDELAMQRAVVAVRHDQLAGMPMRGAQIRPRRASSSVSRVSRSRSPGSPISQPPRRLRSTPIVKGLISPKFPLVR